MTQVQHDEPLPDDFQSGALVTDKNRKIVYANAYFANELSWSLDKLIGKNSDELFTFSSRIFCESYLMPLLIHESKCEEIQLALLDGNGDRVPILVNAKMDSTNNIYWSFFNATKRDTLYEELLEARKELEKQAEILKSMSATDELTGLMNRRELNKRAPELIRQATRYEYSLALFIIDIDFFKKINDSLGHLEGDKVLQALGQRLKNFARETDLVARFGGEEFMLVLPKMNAVDAKNFANKLHKMVADIKVTESTLTVSIGIAISDGTRAFQQLIAQADTALYQAKDAGRNQTIFYQINEVY